MSQAVARSFLLDMEEMSKVSQTGKTLNGLKGTPRELEHKRVWGRNSREGLQG